MKKTFQFTVTALALFLATGVAHAINYTAYGVQAGTVGNQEWTGSLGMNFNVNQDINILSLGAFDSGSNGLSSQITVQLYDRANPASVLAQVVLFGYDGFAVGGSRFLDLSAPITLHSGFLGTIVAFGYNSDEPNGNVGNGLDTNLLNTDNGGGLISFVGGGLYHNQGNTSFPINVDGGPVNRYAAGSFQYTPVPEPGTMMLLGFGMLGLAVYGKRRMNK